MYLFDRVNIHNKTVLSHMTGETLLLCVAQKNTALMLQTENM